MYEKGKNWKNEEATRVTNIYRTARKSSRVEREREAGKERTEIYSGDL